MQDTYSLSIIIPVFNEEKTIDIVMQKIKEHIPSAQMILIDDGSTDQSFLRINKEKRTSDSVITQKNQGKGSAVKRGLQCATGEYCIIQDADLEYNPEDILHLLEVALQESHTAVFGSRRMVHEKKYAHILYYLGGVCTTWWTNILYGIRLTDQHTCYKLIRTDVMKTLELNEKGFGIDTEITIELAKKKIPIVEIPIQYKPRAKKDGKKITMKDGIRCMVIGVLKKWS